MPPLERLTVKRRRDDEPLDTLYIQHKKLRPSTCWKRVPHSSLATVHASPSDIATRAYTPVEPVKNEGHQLRGTENVQDGPESHHVPANGALVTERPLDVANAQSSIPKESPKKLRPRPSYRELDLSRTTGGRVERRGPRILRLAPPVRLRSDKRSGCDGIHVPQVQEARSAVLSAVEHHEEIDKAHTTVTADSDRRSPYVEQVQAHHQSAAVADRRQRRPIVNAAEARRRNATRRRHTQMDEALDGNTRQPTGTGGWNHSDELALRLKHMDIEGAGIAGDNGHVKPVKSLKFRPKPAPPRRTLVDKSSTMDRPRPAESPGLQDWNDDSIVYDIYVRATDQDQDKSHISFINNMSEEEASRIGIVVIEGDEEEDWDNLQDDEASGPDWSSDEDENAEHFYGNEYPDEENSSSSNDGGNESE